MRKQLDPRIPALINHGVKTNHRSFFVLVGDRGRDQVSCRYVCRTQLTVSGCQPALPALAGSRVIPTKCPLVLQEGAGLHNVSQHHAVSADPSHRKKREAKIKRDIKRGIREANEQDPFELFITVTDIRYA